jgi:hypothetical protein
VPAQGWSAPVGRRTTGIGLSYNTSTTLTDVSFGAATNPIWIPGNSLDVGTVLNVKAWGTFAVSATTPTLILGIYYGAVAGVALAATTARAVTDSATVSWPWTIELTGLVVATGTAGSIEVRGRRWLGTSLVASGSIEIPETAALATVAIDTTIAKAITVGAQWGTSAAANIVLCRGMSVETLA